MPVVSYRQRRVDTAPLPGVRKQAAQTPISEGAGLARAQEFRSGALADLGNTIARVGSDQAGYVAQQARAAKEKADQTALLAAQGQLDAWELSTLHDPKTGAFNLHGDAAFALPEQVDEGFNKVTGEITQNLHTDEQRQAFARVVGQRKQQIAVAVRRHVAEEIEAYDGQQLKSTLSNAASLAAVNALDPLRVSQELQRGEGAIATAAAQYHVPEEAKQAQLLAFRTDTHIGVINNLLANDQHQQASDYFEEVKDQIAGDKVDQVTRAVHEGSTRGEAQQASDAIIKEGGTLTEQRDKAKEIKDPEVRDRALDYIEHEDLLRRRDAQVKDEDLMVTAGNLIDKGGIKAVPPGLWAQLTPSQKTGLEQYAKRNLTGGTGDETKARYFDLKSMALNDPTKFIGVNLRNDLAKLSKTELSELLELQDHIRKGDKPKAEAMLDGFRTNTQIVNDTLTLAGESDPKKKAQFTQVLDDKVMALQRLTGKKATNADIQQMADDLLKSVVIEHGAWGNILPFGRSFTDVTKKLSEITVNDIPANDRAQIEQALRTHNRPVTAETILNLYLDTKRRLGDVK